MIKIYEERFNNGTLADFNPAELMKKVQNTGYSVHTVIAIR